jgi:hypothetical protein
MELIDRIRNILYQADRIGTLDARTRAMHDVLWLIAKTEENERLMFKYLDEQRKTTP